MESLVEIPRRKWSELQDVYRADGPCGVVAYCLLDTQISFPELSESFNFKVYCPGGEISNGMIAISDKAGHYQVLIHPINKKITEIEEALLTTKIIDWNRDIMVPSANSDVIDCLERIKQSLGVNIRYDNQSKAYKHIIRKTSMRFENLICPPGTYVGPLKSEHLQIIDKTWTYHDRDSYQFFEILRQHDLGYVLYSSHDEPLAWITVNEAGALTHLYCLEGSRRKGYGEFITKMAINDLLDKGKHVLAYTIEDNVKPQNLFSKLGFEFIGYDHWVFVSKVKNRY